MLTADHRLSNVTRMGLWDQNPVICSSKKRISKCNWIYHILKQEYIAKYIWILLKAAQIAMLFSFQCSFKENMSPKFAVVQKIVYTFVYIFRFFKKCGSPHSESVYFPQCMLYLHKYPSLSFYTHFTKDC